MKNTVKTLFYVCALACVIALSAFIVACGESKKPDDTPAYTEGLSYELSGSGESYYVNGFGSSAEAEIIVPATYQSKPVTGIADYAFSQSNTDDGSLRPTKVTLPDGITYIGEGAFYQCAGLAEINIPESVAEIGKQAFYRCGLESITLTEGITEIAEEMFNECENLKYASLPNTLSKIGDFAFRYCYGLQDLSLPESLRTIGKEAFYGCESLVNVVIPNGVTQIGAGAFRECVNAESITLPANLTRIEEGTFERCESLTAIDFPASLEYIGEYAFENCYSLTAIEFPQKVTVIEEYVMSGCYSLLSVTVHSKITEIKNGAFEGCAKLIEVINLSDLDIEAGEIRHGNVSANALNVYSDKSQSKLTVRADGFAVYVDSETRYIMGYLGKEENINVSAELKNYELYDYVFGYNRNVKSITLPEWITEIPDLAFTHCLNLKTVTLHAGLTEIGRAAFEGCALEELSLPASLEYIGYNAFGETYLNRITFADTAGWYVCTSEYDTDNPEKLTSVSVTDSEKNARMLSGNTDDNTENYRYFIWIKNPAL